MTEQQMHLAFARQVQTACDTAKLAAARLSGKDAPKHADNEQCSQRPGKEAMRRIAKENLVGMHARPTAAQSPCGRTM